MRKPTSKVLRIDGGKPVDDVVTDADYERAALLQDSAWKTHEEAIATVAKIRERILAGARDTSTEWYVDWDRGMVRSRKSKASGE